MILISEGVYQAPSASGPPSQVILAWAERLGAPPMATAHTALKTEALERLAARRPGARPRPLRQCRALPCPARRQRADSRNWLAALRNLALWLMAMELFALERLQT